MRDMNSSRPGKIVGESKKRLYCVKLARAVSKLI